MRLIKPILFSKFFLTVTIACFFLIPKLYTQELITDYTSINARIVDEKTQEGIPYATVFNLSNFKGTISDFEGLFMLFRCVPEDSIRISYIGYETVYFLTSELIEKDTIILKSKEEVLSELNVYGDNTFLYTLFSKSRKTSSNKILEAKTYFALESFINYNVQVEWIEGYYNGVFRGYEMDDLNLKNGRIALDSIENKFFISLQTSKAQYMHRLFEYNEYFPKSPFELSQRKAKKAYQLKLPSSFKNEEGHTILVVDFIPIGKESYSFEGRVWLDSIDASIQKVSLHCIDAKIHPFDPIWDSDSLLQVDLDLVKTFKRVDGMMYVEAIDFNYRLYYKDRLDSLYEINTHNMLFAYDYTESFTLPFYDFGVNEENDYRKVNAATYNDFFWEYMDEFTSYDRKEKNEQFLSKASLNNETLFLGNNFFVNGLFEQPYVFWSPRRITFDESSMKLKNDDVKSIFAPDLYNLNIQIYMDVNYLNDSLQTITRTVLDPFESFFYFPATLKTMAFLNMYFDFVEIQRRELDLELKKVKRSPEEAGRVYQDKITEMNDLSILFFRNVERGNNKEGMLRWNDYIINGLNIDNWEIFRLEYEYE